jgi:HAMP domain-containing protein
LDLDNLWSYLKVHGDPEWQSYPTYLPKFVPAGLDFLKSHDQTITFFVVGRDATDARNADALRQLSEAGHEIANHSFNHEPWMQNYTEEQVIEELKEAETAIEKVTGYKMRGFRGPGYCRSAAILNALHKLGYEYDASILPSILGPIARLYYFSTKKMTKEEKKTRGELFGHLSDGFHSLKPFAWKVGDGDLLEIPVSTIPVFRIPFHLSYLIWLSRYSKSLALAYMEFGFRMCRLRGVEPSYLLHPLDFLGKEDVPELSFFPGMDLPRAFKLEIAGKFLKSYQKHFDVVPMAEHVRRIRARGPVKTVDPALSGA